MSRITQTLTRVQRFWAGRTASEKRTLTLGALLLAPTLGYFALYAPFTQAIQRQRTLVASQDQALVKIRALMQTRTIAPASAPVSLDNASVAALVEQAVAAKNMRNGLKNITPIAANSVRFELGGVNFDQLMAMLETLEREHNLQVLELGIDTLGTSTVNAKIMLQQ
jgi:type II secretory pathway component PulM